MAMNRQRRTSNINNIITYDTLGNVTIPANFTVKGLVTAGLARVDANGLFSVDTTAYQPLLPSQAGNSGKYLTTNGSVISWGTVSTANIYNSDGTLTGDRVVTNSTFLLNFKGGQISLGNEETALRLETSTTGKELIFSLNNLSGKNWLIRSLSSGNLDIRNITNARTSFILDGANSDVTFGGNIKSSLNYFILGAGVFHKALHLGKASVTAANYSIAENGAETMINADTGGLLRFRISNADRMMLTNAGRLLLGTTSESTFILDVNGTARVSGDITNVGNYIQTPNTNGLQIGFFSGNTVTTKSNIAITNSGTGGSGTSQVFPIMTGIRNIYVVGTDGPAAIGSPTISGNDNLILGNNAIGNPISGSSNTLIKSNGAISTGIGNTGIGPNALNGITTGSNNIHLTIGAGYGNGSFASSLSNSVYIGDPVKTNNYTTVAGDIVITTPYTISTQFWFGGKSDATDVYFNSPAQIGTNQTGAVQYWRASIGTGSGNAGKTIFQHSTPVASGSTLHSAFTDTLTLERTKIYTPSTVNTILGSIADSGLYRLDVQGAARITGDVTLLKTSGNSGLILKTLANGNPSLGYTFNGNASIGQTINFSFGVTTISTWDNAGASISAVLGVVASASTGLSSYVFAATRGATSLFETDFLFGIQGSGNVICRNGATIKADSFAYAVGGDLNIQGGQPRGDVPNGSGGNLNVNGGLGTGTGTSGDVIIATATPTSTGTTLQTLTNRVWIKGQTGNVGIGASPDAAYKLDVQGASRVSGGLTFSGGSYVAGSVYYSSSLGLVVAGKTGTTYDLILTDGNGNGKIFISNTSGVTSVPITIDGFLIGGSYGINGSLFKNSSLGAILQGNTTASTFSVSLFGGNATNGLFIKNDGTIKVGFYNSTFNSSAILEAVSTTQGFLPPRMTTTQKNAIATPAAGLIVYDSTTNTPNYYNGTAWLDYGLNIYNSNGTLSGNRTVTIGDYSLSLSKTQAGLTGANDFVGTSIVSAPTTNASIAWSTSKGFFNYQGIFSPTFGGDITFQNSNYVGQELKINRITFAAASSTVTLTQGSGGNVRAFSNAILHNYVDGTNSGTISHFATLAMYGDFASSSARFTFTNRYGLLINDFQEYGQGHTYTNRWAIYQIGANDNNYFKGKVVIGSTDTVGASPLNVKNLPTSATGLSTGDVWNNLGVLMIV